MLRIPLDPLPIHRYVTDTDACTCGAEVVYFEDPDMHGRTGEGCAVTGVWEPRRWIVWREAEDREDGFILKAGTAREAKQRAAGDIGSTRHLRVARVTQEDLNTVGYLEEEDV